MATLQRYLDLLLTFAAPPNIMAEFGAFGQPISLHAMVFVVYSELRRRMTLIKSGVPTVDDYMLLHPMFLQMRRMAVTSAVDIARLVEGVASLSWLTNLPFTLLREWAVVLMEEGEVVCELQVDRIGALKR